MEQKVLRSLMKKELLHSIWLEIDKLTSEFSNSNITQFGHEISGNHSWYSSALNKGEDIQLSSLIRVFAQLDKENNQKERIPFERIFTEKILKKGLLLSHLTSTKEDPSYLPIIIEEYQEIFEEIRNNLLPLYREGQLGDKELIQGYEELTKILQKMGNENNG